MATVFREADGRTTVTAAVLYALAEARAAVLRTPMLEGWGQCLDRLAVLLEESPGKGQRSQDVA